MPDIPINNETEYSLTPEMSEQIKRDAFEYFGESVRAVRVQYGIERHAFNARTGEMRYAFSPSDFGLVDTTIALPETYFSRADLPTIDDDSRAVVVHHAAFGDVEPDADAEDEDEVEDDEKEDETEVPLESLEEDDLDDSGNEDEEEITFQSLEDQFEDIEDEDAGGFVYDDDDYE